MSLLQRVREFCAAFTLAVLLFASAAFAQGDPLPSWQDTPTKKAIIAFVESVTGEGNPDFVKPEERIAVFDMDGTLVPEKPVPVALIPIVDDIKEAVAQKPFLGEKPAVAALLTSNEDALHAAGQQGILDLTSVATDGKTTEEVVKNVKPLLDTQTHPKYAIPYAKTVYQPMRELLAFLEENGFTNWISSGSPVLITRVMSDGMFGIPRSGSSALMQRPDLTSKTARRFSSLTALSTTLTTVLVNRWVLIWR